MSNQRDPRVNPVAGDELITHETIRVVRVRQANARYRAVEYKRLDAIYSAIESMSMTEWRRRMKGAGVYRRANVEA